MNKVVQLRCLMQWNSNQENLIAHNKYKRTIIIGSGFQPLYRNPFECPLVEETIERYKAVKPILVKMLIEKKQKESLAQKYQTEKYNVMYAEWLAKDERYCRSQKKTFVFPFFKTFAYCVLLFTSLFPQIFIYLLV